MPQGERGGGGDLHRLEPQPFKGDNLNRAAAWRGSGRVGVRYLVNGLEGPNHAYKQDGLGNGPQKIRILRQGGVPGRTSGDGLTEKKNKDSGAD
jgi:hypothetical protein